MKLCLCVMYVCIDHDPVLGMSEYHKGLLSDIHHPKTEYNDKDF